MRLILMFLLALTLLESAEAQTCDQTLSVGANVASAASSAASGSVICLTSGNYGNVELVDINRTGYVTIKSVTATVATMSPSVGNSKYIRLSNLTINGALQNSCSRNIEWTNNVVADTITLSNDGCSGSLATLFDGNTFGAIDTGSGYEGRLSIIYGSGVVIKNNTFGPGGASDGVFLGGDVSNVTIGPGNVFTGILESLCGAVHCDAVQGYGAGTGVSIEGNLFRNGDTFIMMPDGSTGVSVRNNVFDGAGVSYPDKIQFGSASSPVFQHNTLRNVRASFDSKTGEPASSNALAENNLLDNASEFKTTNGNGCSSCTFQSNTTGTPTFVGGSNPTTLAGFKLTTGSIGYQSAPDGTDMGAIIAAAGSGTCAQEDVQAAIDSAVSGDTVNVPSGTCEWTTGVTITNKNIRLIGAGASGGTTLTRTGGSFSFVAISTNLTGYAEVRGFSFSGPVDAGFANAQAISFSGPIAWKNLRIHHNTFDGCGAKWAIRGNASSYSLIDNNTFSGGCSGMQLTGRGKKDWSAPVHIGAADFMFVEGNTFDAPATGSTGTQGVDVIDGGRVVFRNNTLTNTFVGTNDKARSGLPSAAVFEIYSNTFTAPSTAKAKALDITAGTGVVYSNTFTGSWTTPISALDYKTSAPGVVALCDGSDPNDQNVLGQAGWRCQYQVGSHGEGPAAYGAPVYVWSNTHNGSPAGMSCTAGCTHVQSGRDYINNGTTPKPGYTAYTYPHPLAAP